MSGFVFFAAPWWVNLLVLIPLVPWLISLKTRLALRRAQLLLTALFAIAFGFVEAAVVVYLRAVVGVWPGPPPKPIVAIPGSLIRIETFREAATMTVLAVMAWLATQGIRKRISIFLWTFAIWDLFYYIWLHVTIGWPASLLDSDLLFLIPVPWISQVWFPVLVSAATALVVWFRS